MLRDVGMGVATGVACILPDLLPPLPPSPSQVGCGSPRGFWRRVPLFSLVAGETISLPTFTNFLTTFENFPCP